MPTAGSKIARSAPISVSTFYHSLQSIVFACGGHFDKYENRIGAFHMSLPDEYIAYHTAGIAVSGGVDSMALAHLCANLQKTCSVGPENRFVFLPFIIDHRARPGSTQEAVRTKLRLETLGKTYVDSSTTF